MNRQLNTILMTLPQIILKCVFKLCFEATSGLLVFVFAISRTTLYFFFKVTPIIIFVWFLILSAFPAII